MKVGVTAMVFALDALSKLGWVPGADVFVQTVSEEECTGNGALSTLVRGYRADACLIPEAMNDRLIRAQLGSVWFRIRIKGIPAQLGAIGNGGNAILMAYDYIEELKALRDRINQTSHESDWYKGAESPVGLNIGKIRGGDWVGSVPAWCEIDCRLNVLPNWTLPQMREAIVDAVTACASRIGAKAVPDISWIGFQAEAYVLEPGSEAEKALSLAHQTVFGAPMESVVINVTSDIRQYGLYYGMPALCYGPSGGGNPHSSNEYTSISAMMRSTLVIALFIAQWCGLKRAT